MAVNLKALTTGRRTVPVTFNEQTVQVTYNPAAITTRMLSQLSNDEAKPAEQMETVAAALSKLLVEWDIELDPGHPLPTDVDTVQNLPIEFTNIVFKAVVEDSQGKAA